MYIKFQQTGTKLPEDYNKFINFSKTAPSNRRPDSTWVFGNPKQYDHYGMWEQLGKPIDWIEALKSNPNFKPNQQDGLYHGYSVNPRTNILLKPHTPGVHDPNSTTWMELDWFKTSTDPNFNPNTHKLIFDTEINRLRYVPVKMHGGIIRYKK